MTWLDYGVLLVLAVSIVLGAWRGLMRELFALAGWIAAVVLAVAFTQPVAALLPDFVSSPALRAVLAFLGIFFAVLLSAGLAGLLAAKALRVAGLGFSDRAFGGVFGLARGAVIVLVLVLVAGMTSIPREPFWRQAILAGPLETGALAVRGYLPASLAERVRYN